MLFFKKSTGTARVTQLSDASKQPQTAFKAI